MIRSKTIRTVAWIAGCSGALVAIVFAAVAATGGVPQMNVHTEIEIEAPVSEVRRVLADLASYPTWNPYHVLVVPDATPAVGTRLNLTIHKPDGETVQLKPRITAWSDTEISWGGGIRWLFWGNHRFLIEAIDDNRTRLVHDELFTGIALRFIPLHGIEEGYNAMNQALKRYVEG